MSKGRKYAIAMTAALGFIMAILDNTIVNIALIPISKDLKTDLATVQWLVTGYFLSQAAVIPVAGYLGNRFGTRRLFALCIVFFTLGSLLCGIAGDITLLIIFRVIQGIGAGALFPIAQTLALDPFEPEERAGATSLIVIPVLLGPILGPILGGWLNDSFGWHYLFLINVPIGILTVYLTFTIIPKDKPIEETSKKRFDYIGLVLSTLGILAVVYAFTLVNQTDPASRTAANPNGATYGWSYWLVWTLVAVGVLLLAGFAVYALRLADPIVDLKLFKDYNFTIASFLTWVTSATIFSATLLLPIFLQQERQPNMSALDTGLALAPQGVGAVIGVAISGPFFNKIGVRIITGAGAIFVIVSLWQFSTLTVTSDGWTMAPWNVLLGIGLGFSFIPSQTLAFLSLSGEALAKGASLFNATRQIASSIATAVTVAVLAQLTSQYAAPIINAATRQLPAGATFDPNDPKVQAATNQLIAPARVHASNDVFLYLAIASVLVLVLAFFLPSKRKMQEQQEARTEASGGAPVAVHMG